MNQHNLSARLLNAFVTLAHCRQFNVAAQRCHMSQPAFSQAIRRLEREVGTDLFDRSTRSVSLTPEGELFLPVAQQVIDDLKQGIDHLRNHAALRVGKVAVAALPSIAAEWLPSRLMAYRKCHPGIAVQLLDGMLQRTLSLVREGVADFAITADVALEDEFDVRPLFEDRFFLVCKPDHPLAKRKSVLLEHLADRPYIHSIRTASVWRQLYPYLRQVPLRDSGFEVAYLATIAGLIANGAGISVVTGTSLFNFTRAGLVAIPVRDKGLRYQVMAVKRRGKALSTAAQALEDLLAAGQPGISLKSKDRVAP